nr:hypothetical protein [Tanacetum cinerariifolium]
IIKENLPPPNNNPNSPEEEPILDQAPAALVGFAPQWIGEKISDNNNETEFAPPVVQIADADDVPIPPSVHRGVKRLSTQMHDRIMPPKRRSQTNPQPTLTQEDVDQLVRDGIEVAIRDERERVATLGREVANARPWAEVKQMMTAEFCLTKELQRLEDELRNLKQKDMNIAAYTERFKELALLCPDAVPNEKKKVELYIKGLPKIIKGETTSSRPVTLNEAVRMTHALMEQKLQAKNERIAEGLKRKWENNNQGNNNNNNNNNHNRGNYRNNNHHNQNNNQRQNNARALTTAPNTGANQTGVAPKCNRCGRCHFDQCPSKCESCGRIGHKAKDYRSRNLASGAAV